jgi:hypothetical protein
LGTQSDETGSDRWEIGSDFQWIGLPPPPFIPWPEPATWFLLGRHAVAELLRSLSSVPRRLWIPSYFCHDVADYWRGFCTIAMYADSPDRKEPDWETLQPANNDIVLAVNYFGVRSREPWLQWREKHACVLLEDHSHDPVSEWALHSRADYAFSSLRKTIAVPDGAILWSPQGNSLPQAIDEDFSGSALKLAAMIWKREYLEGRASPEVKPIYRQWQQAGEDALERSTKPYPTTRFSRQYLASGMPVQWRKRREANVRQLLRQGPSSDVQPLFNSWPSGSAPLAAVFRFASRMARDRIRERLEAASIYCPIHWPAPLHCEDSARELASTILTVPSDQRYGKDDMDRIASVLFRGE